MARAGATGFAESAHTLRCRIAAIPASPALPVFATSRAIEWWPAKMLDDGVLTAAELAGEVYLAWSHRADVALDRDGDWLLHIFLLKVR